MPLFRLLLDGGMIWGPEGLHLPLEEGLRMLCGRMGGMGANIYSSTYTYVRIAYTHALTYIRVFRPSHRADTAKRTETHTREIPNTM